MFMVKIFAASHAQNTYFVTMSGTTQITDARLVAINEKALEFKMR